MDHSYIMPFIKSVQNVFETMLQLTVQVGNPTLKRGSEPSYDVSGIIALSGDLDGTVVLSFPTATAERVVSLFTGTDMVHSHEDFPDAVGELVNMISGGAKAQFPAKKVTISCPSVVIGTNHSIFGRKDVVSIQLPCVSDCGEFDLEVNIRQSSQALKNPSSAAEMTA